MYRAKKNTMTEQEIEKLNDEFSNEFDVLYNNITSNLAPGLDEYEKSVFLTKAQNEIVKAYFNPKSNKVQEGFDGNERRLIDFSMIMRSKAYNEGFEDSFFDMRENTKSITLEDDILMFINEYVEVTRGRDTARLTVLPIKYVEYSRLMSKPYKRPLKNRAWRLLDNSDGHKKAEIIIGPNDTLTKYIIRYVKRPRAIRLTTFDDVTLEGGNTIQCCELDPILYPEIIQRACELAKAAYMGDLNSQIALGQTSLTNIGMVTQSR